MFREFVIKVNEFNLELTMYSGQTSQPPWSMSDEGYSELLMVNERPALVTIKQLEGELQVKLEAPEKIPSSHVKKKIDHIFDLNFDLEDLYDFLYSHPPLRPVIDYSRGLRLFLAKDLFECVVSSIASANCSIKRWTRAIDHIKESFGRGYSFSQGRFYNFPFPQILANLGLKDPRLRSSGVGYRDKYIIETARKITRISLKKIGKLDYDSALNLLLEFPGIGPKVADCILLYGFRKLDAFPLDLWIRKIMRHIYNIKFDDRQLRDFAREEFGEYAGYIQLYLFNYARRAGIV